MTCHPTKTPNMENLLPRGGGAFLAEVDGNLVCIKQASTMTVEVTTHGKFRGPDFAPFGFELVAGQSEKLVDSKGRMIWTIFAKPISAEDQEKIEENRYADQDRLLFEMLHAPGPLSLAKYAERLGWRTIVDRKPNKQRVQRLMKELEKHKLAEQLRSGKYTLTRKGVEQIEAIAAENLWPLPTKQNAKPTTGTKVKKPTKKAAQSAAKTIAKIKPKVKTKPG